MNMTKDWKDTLITRLIHFSGYSSILFVALIFFFLMSEGLPALGEVELSNLFSNRWYPIENYFGIIPLLGGSLLVTLGSMFISIPIGIGSAIYMAEIAPRWGREILKPCVEVLAGIPSVVLGFIGVLVLTPAIRKMLDIPTGLTAFTGSVLLAAISIPTIVSIADDALHAVPRSYRDAALALGVTQWQTIWHVTLPAARTGVLTACMLGVGRTIGETMAVMMVTGNAPIIPKGLADLFSPVRTMTATIASEMGEVATGSVHYHILFLIGIILFLISLVVNITASAVVFRQRKRAERILS